MQGDIEGIYLVVMRLALHSDRVNTCTNTHTHIYIYIYMQELDHCMQLSAHVHVMAASKCPCMHACSCMHTCPMFTCNPSDSHFPHQICAPADRKRSTPMHAPRTCIHTTPRRPVQTRARQSCCAWTNQTRNRNTAQLIHRPASVTSDLLEIGGFPGVH